MYSISLLNIHFQERTIHMILSINSKNWKIHCPYVSTSIYCIIHITRFRGDDSEPGFSTKVCDIFKFPRNLKKTDIYWPWKFWLPKIIDGNPTSNYVCILGSMLFLVLFLEFSIYYCYSENVRGQNYCWLLDPCIS